MSKKEKNDFLLNRGVVEIIEKNNLEQQFKNRRKLRVKFGIDPTAPFLHLGSAAALRKLRQFQDLGHQAVFIIGDFTAMIGDPAGREIARRPLTEAEIKLNVKDYLNQAGKIINLKKAEIYYNSDWFKKGGVKMILELTRAGSVQQILRREDFQKRIQAGRDIALLEALYPLMQGYDSVKVKADVEIGATEQKFNLLMGRRVQRYFGMPEQNVMIFKILIGTDGVKKMSKTSGNVIKIEETPDTQFAQVMNLKDESMPMYFELLTDIPDKKILEIGNLIKRPDGNLKKIKSQLAFEIVKSFHGKKAAEKALLNFDNIFKEKNTPDALKEFKITKPINLKELIVRAGLAVSGAASQRLIEQGAVSLNGEILKDWRGEIKFKKSVVLKVGKHQFLKVLP